MSTGVPTAVAGSGKPATGFISYSRRDAVELATALQVALERFAKPWYLPRRARIFRDDASMSANPDLRGTIEGALARADWFIVLLSPGAAASSWVASEIRWWLEHRSADRILLVLASGEAAWDPSDNRFDLQRSSAVPPVLERAFPREPRWVDLSWYAGPGSLGAADPRFPERVADIAAPLHGADRADLIGENVRQHRRALRMARGGVAALSLLLVFSLVATVLAVRQRSVADAQRDAAVHQNRISVARQLAATAVNLADTDLQQAALVAVQAHRLHPDGQTAAALWTTAAASPHLVGFLDAGAPVTATSGTPDGRVVVAGTAAGEVLRWDRRTGERDQLLTLPHEVRRVMVSDDGQVVAASGAEAGSPGSGAVWRQGVTTRSQHEVVALSPSGQLLAEVEAGDGVEAVRLLIRAGDRVVLDRRVQSASELGWVQLPSETRVVLVGVSGQMSAYALPSGRRVLRGRANTGAHQGVASVDPTGRFVAATNGDKRVEIDPVVDLAEDESPTAAGRGRTETVNPVAVALSAGAGRLATAIDGRIWVGQVLAGPDADPPAPVVLTGSGTAREGTLRFLNQSLLISGAGTAVGVWDLGQASRLGLRVPVRYLPACNGCGPGRVEVNPSGTRALVINEDGSSAALVDLRTGLTSHADYSGGDLRLAARHAVWLDDDHVFTWDDRKGVATVATGPRMRQVARWSVPGQQRAEDSRDPASLVLRAIGGQVVLLDSSGRVLRFDPARHTGTASQVLALADPVAVGLDPTASRAWSLSWDDTSKPTRTRLQVHELEPGRQPLVDRTLDGAIGSAALIGDELHLWEHGGRWTRLHLPSGTLTTLPHTLRAGSALATRQPFAVFEKEGTVSLYDTSLRTVVGSLSVPTAAYAWTQFGFSSEDQVLVVATATFTEGESSVRAVRFGYRQWQQLNCTMAGRDLTADEWRSLTDLTVPSSLRCHG